MQNKIDFFDHPAFTNSLDLRYSARDILEKLGPNFRDRVTAVIRILVNVVALVPSVSFAQSTIAQIPALTGCTRLFAPISAVIMWRPRRIARSIFLNSRL